MVTPGVLQEYLGLKKVIWFWRGICGDDAVVNGCARLPRNLLTLNGMLGQLCID